LPFDEKIGPLNADGRRHSKSFCRKIVLTNPFLIREDPPDPHCKRSKSLRRAQISEQANHLKPDEGRIDHRFGQGRVINLRVKNSVSRDGTRNTTASNPQTFRLPLTSAIFYPQIYNPPPSLL
jgi:hypothetical protein